MNAQQLKNAILQEAIEGRLVPQDPNDEPASALLARIRQEKEQLVKEGKLKKKDLVVKPISEDEIPFDIPETWEWVRLKDLVILITKGSSPSWQGVKYVDNGILFITSENVREGYLELSSPKFLEDKFNDIQSRSILKKGDLLTNIVGASIGRTAEFNLNLDNCNINQAVAIIRLIEKSLNSYFLKVLNSSFIIAQMVGKTVETARPNISLSSVENLIVPLPPLAEQHRIVSKIEELLPKVEEYGKAQDALNKLNAELPERLKKSILQEAIEGRLVPQDPNDEPASVLLAKIRQEKEQLVKEGKLKKKNLEESPIINDEVDFILPTGWEWCRLGILAEFINGLAFKPEDWETKGMPIIRIQNLTDYSRPMNYTTKVFDNKFKVENGDLLFSWSATLDSFIWNGRTAWLNQHIFKVIPYGAIEKRWLFYALKAIVVQLSLVTHGLTMKHLTRGVFENYPIALPPFSEQKRIVEKLEQVLGEIDKLKK